MARYPYRQQPQMVDTGDVPYISYTSEQAEPLMMQAAANAQQRYDLAQTAIAKYLEENAAAKFRDADYNTAMAKLNQELENIKATVKDTYDNQYGQAYPEILKGLSKARQTYHLAQKAYEEEQKYAPLITKLATEKKLLFAPNAKGEVVDPRTQSVFNEKGEYVGGLDYSNIREKSDYDKTIEDAIVRGIDKTAIESGLINSKTAGYLMQLQQSGLAALTPEKIDQIAEEYAPIFEAQTTYGIDPDKPKGNSKEYVKDAIYRLASSKTGRQYIADRNYDPDAGKKDPNAPDLRTFGAARTESVRENPFYEKKESLYSALDKKTSTSGILGTSYLSGAWDNISDIDKEINKNKELQKTHPRFKNLYQQSIDELEKEKERLQPAIEVLDEYKQEKTKELNSRKLPIPQTDSEWAKLYDADDNFRSKTTDTYYTLNPLPNEGVKYVFSEDNKSLQKDISYRISGEGKLGNVKLENIADELDLGKTALEYQLRNSNYNYNKTTGEFFTDIYTDGEYKEGKFTPTSDSDTKRIYFTLDTVTSTYADLLKKVKKINSNQNKEEGEIYADRLLRVAHNGDQTYNITMYNPQTKGYETDWNLSTGELQDIVANIIDGHIQNKYTVPSLTFTQQKTMQNPKR